MPFVHQLMAIIGYASLIVAAGYALAAALAGLAWHARRSLSGRQHPAPQRPPVTVLKPLCGAEPGLHEHLRSFCQQDYPEFQLVFGVRDPADPALTVVARLVQEFPSLAIDVVVDPRLHGSNLKVSNLINMVARARHDVFAIADSDTWVGPDYLATVTAPLLDQGVGLVNCLYRDVPTGRVWSRLGAMYINEWYMPAVVLAQLFGYRGYVSGQTLCVRRGTLHDIGGLQAVADHLADDHRLGVLVRALGLRIVCSRYLVSAQHDEPDFSALARHELRWMGTLRVLQPHSFRFLCLTFSLPLALLGLAFAVADPAVLAAAWAPFWIALAARLALHWAHRLGGERHPFADLWLLVGRDFLIAWVWCRCFFSRRVSWRGAQYDVGADGIMRRLS